MFHPFLFIGVGGSGGDTLHHLYGELEARLSRVGLAMPVGWQFLHIDTRATQEFDEALPRKEGISYVGLVERNLTYQTVVRSLGQRGDAVRAAFSGWRPDPNQVHVAIEEGAGQFRAIGRTIGLLRLERINREITAAVERVETHNARASLFPVAQALNGKRGGLTNEAPIVVVFSSLAGGTGSGIFLDVCDLLRGQSRTWTDNSVAILYAPDVFDELHPDERRGVQPNALASVSELLAAHWLSEPGVDPVHHAAGIEIRDMQRGGPGYTFLVGTSNDQLSFNKKQDVFGVVGRTAAAWATSKSIQQKFSGYVQGNWQNGARRADPLELAGSMVDMPFSALGYAGLRLGREVFREYATQCLARVVAERLLTGAAGSIGDGTVDVDSIVRRRSAEFTAKVLRVSSDKPFDVGVFELFSPNRTQVLDSVVAELRTRVERQDRTLPDWLTIISTLVDEHLREILPDRNRVLNQAAEQWAGTVADGVAEAVQQSIALDGLVVTEKLLRGVVDELTVNLVLGLDAMAVKDEMMATTTAGEVEQALGEEPKRRWRKESMFPVDHERVRDALARGVEMGVGRALDGITRRLAATLLRDFCTGLLVPLLDELSDAVLALRGDATPSRDGRQSLIGSWPQASSFAVPNALLPARTQLLVDDPDDYPDTFLRLVREAVPGAERAGDALAQATLDILLGTWQAEVGVKPVVEQTRTWEPEMRRQWTRTPVREQTAGYRVAVTGKDLLKRVDEWVGQARGLGPYLRETLSDALGDAQPNAEQRRRLDRYTRRFLQALEASAPLVRIDPAYRTTYLDSGGVGDQRLISQIPLAPGSLAYEETSELLLRHTSVTEETLADQFNIHGSGEIEFTTFLSAPCHPMAFSSLTVPIRRDWAERRSDYSRRTAFGLWRRARTIPRATPLPHDARLALVRGWFLGAAGGGFEVVDGGQHLVLGGGTGGTRFPLMTEPPRDNDVFDGLAAILESTPLTLLGHLNSDDNLAAGYQELLRLDGRRAGLLSGRDGGELVAVLQKWQGMAEDRFPERMPNGSPRAWELRSDILDALAVLLAEAVDPR